MSLMPFGKHAGEDLEDIPTDYLVWFVTATKSLPPEDKRHAERKALIAEMDAELASRKKYGWRGV